MIPNPKLTVMLVGFTHGFIVAFSMNEYYTAKAHFESPYAKRRKEFQEHWDKMYGPQLKRNNDLSTHARTFKMRDYAINRPMRVKNFASVQKKFVGVVLLGVGFFWGMRSILDHVIYGNLPKDYSVPKEMEMFKDYTKHDSA